MYKVVLSKHHTNLLPYKARVFKKRLGIFWKEMFKFHSFCGRTEEEAVAAVKGHLQSRAYKKVLMFTEKELLELQ